MSILVAAITVIAASGVLVQVARIGHSGAKTPWSDVSSAAQPAQSFVDVVARSVPNGLPHARSAPRHR